MSFDEDGRAYVVEMLGYMLDIDRTRERDPIGRISRLEDTDGDGKFDKSTIYVDGLILPRAVAATRGGILYVSDYKLFFAQDTDGDGKADRNELVDAAYGGGNVEHAPNALFRAMDNWIYNGESPTRYRLVGNTLVRGSTETRGQWGMTQDNYGRLLYNVNNSQLLGDYTPANYMGRNPNHQASSGINLFVSTDQRVFPIRMNTAINRGYSPDVINPANGKAFVFASSCAPLVYRGDNFPAEFVGNAFVADPALNLLKRNLLSDDNLTLTSRFAYEDKEFLAATDERFRPSNLYNGPDGALWVVDLYRGIAQYGQFMTAYLKRDTLERGLDKGIHYGRIYRIVSSDKKPNAFPKLSAENNAALVGRLSDANGWIRDTAQRLLIERGDRAVTDALVRVIGSTGNTLGRIHALWTLEGLYAQLPTAPAADGKLIGLLNTEAGFALQAPSVPAAALEAVVKAIGDSDAKVQVAAIRVAESFASANATRQQAVIGALNRLAAAAPEEVLFQAALSAGNLGKTEALPLLVNIATRSSEHLIVRDAIMSSLQGSELQFLQLLLANAQWNDTRPGRPALLQALASAVIKERDPAKVGTLLAATADQKPAQGWRSRSLLEGMASNAGRVGVRPIAFTTVPAGIDTLSKSTDAATAQQLERVKSLFSWPGHQSDDGAKVAVRPLTAEETTSFNEGRTIYTTICFACHGATGQGQPPLAPPVANSEWTLGSDERLIRILLHGMSGPVTVGGTRYAPPNIAPEMPPLGAALDDAKIAGVLTYIRRSWGHEADPVTAAKVAAVRAATADRKSTWTEEQLQAIK